MLRVSCKLPCLWLTVEFGWVYYACCVAASLGSESLRVRVALPGNACPLFGMCRGSGYGVEATETVAALVAAGVDVSVKPMSEATYYLNFPVRARQWGTEALPTGYPHPHDGPVPARCAAFMTSLVPHVAGVHVLRSPPPSSAFPLR